MSYNGLGMVSLAISKLFHIKLQIKNIFEKQILVYLLSANELYPLLAAFYPSLSMVLLMFLKNITPHSKLIKEMVKGRLIWFI